MKPDVNNAKELLQRQLKRCGPDGLESVRITHLDGNHTPTGRSDYFDIEVLGIGEDGRPAVVAWLTMAFCNCSRYRFNKKREAVSVPGYGFNKAHQIATELAAIVGHDLHVQGAWNGTIETGK